MSDPVETLLAERKERLATGLGRSLELPPSSGLTPLTPEKRSYLLGEAQSLYWNELEWENITEEERMDGGGLVELTFPGFLAYVRGLLLDQVMPDALAEAEPRPEVVQDITRFLAERVVELRGALGSGDGEDDRISEELAMTGRLVDLVLAELYGVTPEERERLEDGAAR